MRGRFINHRTQK